MGDHDHNHGDPTKAFKAGLEKLREAGLRITKPRRAILKILLQLEKPATIEEIYQNLEPGFCDLATVYRCLGTFEELALVRLCHFRDGTSLYEIDRGPDHQHHIVCTTCNKVETLDFCMVEGLERLVRNRGYRNVSHLLEFFGVCGNCVEETGIA